MKIKKQRVVHTVDASETNLVEAMERLLQRAAAHLAMSSVHAGLVADIQAVLEARGEARERIAAMH